MTNTEKNLIQKKIRSLPVIVEITLPIIKNYRKVIAALKVP